MKMHIIIEREIIETSQILKETLQIEGSFSLFMGKETVCIKEKSYQIFYLAVESQGIIRRIFESNNCIKVEHKFDDFMACNYVKLQLNYKYSNDIYKTKVSISF